MEKIGWSFPSNNYGQRQGISDSGVETFKGSPIQSLAREICQNSLDAGVEGKTVYLEFVRFKMPSKNFPGRNEFLSALDKSIETWKHQKSKKTKDFLKNAKNLMQKQEISFLRISDFNTTGLMGSHEGENTDWSNLVKSTGSSDKSDEAGGSFGIGKFAPFASSELRTVFYSTIDIHSIQATQGIARLVSHKINLDREEETQGSGYYGVINKHRPLKEHYSYDSNFKRNQPGTDIFIAGFNRGGDWKTELINEFLGSFLYSILQGGLEINIDNIIQLNKETVHEIVEKYKDVLSKKTLAYYYVFISEETKWISKDFNNYGEISLGLLLKEEYAVRKVAMIRKPWMKIVDQDGISGSAPFVGVLIIQGHDLNRFLRKMENPKHVKWEPERLESKDEKSVGKEVLRSLKRFIKDELSKLITDDGVEKLDIEGAGDYIPLEDENSENSSNIDDYLNPQVVETEVQELESIKENQKSKPKDDSKNELLEMIEAGVVDEGEEAYINPHGEGENSDQNTPGDKKVNVNPLNEGKAYIPVKVEPIKNKMAVIDKSRGKYRLAIVVDENLMDCELSVKKVDEQGGKSGLKISKAYSNGLPLDMKGNRIVGFSLEANINKSIDFITEEMDYFSAEVTIHGIKK